MPLPFPIQSAAITGASRGIGAAFARELAKTCPYLLLIARNEGDLQKLRGELHSGCEVELLSADLATAEGQELAAQKIQDLPRLDLLINNAGFGRPWTFQETDYATHEAMIRLHIDAVACLTHSALPGMRERRHGAVITVSSIIAMLPYGSNVSYTATKAYGVNFSLALSEELRGTGIRAQVLCPGLTHTNFHEAGGFEDASKLPGFFWKTPEEVVAASLKALNRDQALCIPGLLNRLMAATGKSRLPCRIMHWLRHKFDKKS